MKKEAKGNGLIRKSKEFIMNSFDCKTAIWFESTVVTESQIPFHPDQKDSSSCHYVFR